MPSFQPTAEQLDARDKFRTGRPLKIVAFAGAGKTATLMLLAEARRARGLYLAFNRAIAGEAKAKFAKNVDCRTTHSIAWRTVQPLYRFSSGKMSQRLGAKELAHALELAERAYPDAKPLLRLTGVQRAHLLLGTVRAFCQSADPELTSVHVPISGRLLGAPGAVSAAIQADVLKDARSLWARMINPGDPIPLGHDGYLKLWALGCPTLPVEYVLLDEAQDTNPVVLGVLGAQAAQIVCVGDPHQQIYEWRGAINAMEQFTGEEAYLTQSFRFGDVLAQAASRVLLGLGEPRPVLGNPRIESAIVSDHAPSSGQEAVLTRTNATVIIEVLDALARGLRPHVIGGAQDLKRLAGDVFELKKGHPAASPEFFGFTKWPEVVAFSETEEGEDLRPFVQLIEQHGERKLWAALRNIHEDEATADVIVSTAHKAKGREWDTVRLTGDFVSSRLRKGQARAEVRLFYVAMTRAKQRLAVDSALLDVFTSGSWRTAPVDAPAKSPASSVDRASAPPIAMPPPNPPPSSTTTSSAAASATTATARPARRDASPAPAITPDAPGFWGRVTRFLRG